MYLKLFSFCIKFNYLKWRIKSVYLQEQKYVQQEAMAYKE